MRRVLSAIGLMFAVAAVAPAAMAADTQHSLGVFLNYIEPTGDYSEAGLTIEADSAIGYGLSYRNRFNEKWDFGASLFFADHDVEGEAFGFETKIGETSWMPILFDANYHFGNNGSFYVGPTLGYAFWDDVDLVGGGTLNVDDDFVFGANFGVDLPLGADWKFAANLRYLFVAAEGDAGTDVDVDPLIVGLGVNYQF